MTDTQRPAAHIIDALPVGALEGIGMTQRTIRHARSVGTFAAAWYAKINRLCFDHGVPCPISAFRWKEAPDKKIGNQEPDRKVSAVAE